MSKLYEINAEIERLSESLIDPDTGEVNEEVFAEMERLGMDRQQKIENALCLSKNLMSDAEQIAEEAKNLKERAERKVRRAEAIQNWISHELNGEPFETTRVLVKWRRTQSVDITDEYQIPDEYLSVKTVSKPDKMRIKGDLKEGVRIPGAVLVEKNNMIVK